MNDINANQLTSSIREFEKTIEALKRIEEISENVSSASNAIEQAKEETTEEWKKISELSIQLRSIADNMEKTYKDESGKLGENIDGFKKSVTELSAFVSAKMETLSSDVANAANTYSRSVTELRTQNTSNAQEIRSKVDDLERRTSKEIEDLSAETEKRLSAMDDEIRKAKNQSVKNEKLITVGMIAAIIAALANILIPLLNFVG